MAGRDSNKAAPQPENLQRVLADLGVGSRRAVGDWIKAGRVLVDGETAQLSQRVSADAVIEFDGRKITRRDITTRPRILVMNKSPGTIVTRNDPKGRTTVFEKLPRIKGARWLSIGRLDFNTSGLLLFTDNGLLAQALTHPSSQIDREYAVRVKGKLRKDQISRLTRGVKIDGHVQRFSDLQYYDGGKANHWYHVVLFEGRNREIHKLFKSVGIMVSRLKRVRYGPVILPSKIAVGRCLEMSEYDVVAICRWLELDDRFNFSRVRSKRAMRDSMLIPYPGVALGQPG